jgi:hypothetical protein
MKYTARVKRVLVSGIHKWARRDSAGQLRYEDMPHPDYVFIEAGSGDNASCMMHRYKDDGAFCGDTWHESIIAAKHRAEVEYGLADSDWAVQKDA